MIFTPQGRGEHLKNFIRFIVFAYWPVPLGHVAIVAETVFVTYLTVLMLVVPGGCLSKSDRQDMLSFDIPVLLFDFVLTFVLPYSLIFLSMKLCQRRKSPIGRFFCIYPFWLVFLFLGFYVFSAAIAGMSMAVTEGAIGGLALKMEELYMAFTFMIGPLSVVPHVLILAWSVFVAKKLFNRSKKMDTQPNVLLAQGNY
jgi:hypothetical protein